jgi:BASS family bile acid:Na+ symporter
MMSSGTPAITALGILFVIANGLALGMSLKVGEILADFFKNWKFALRVLVTNFVVLPALIIGLAAIIDVPADIKIGYCIVALAAGAPFAPLLTRLAKGDVVTSTMLFLALVVGTLVVVPLALPPTVTAVAPSIKQVGAWSVAWPLLVFLAAPILLGCVVRLRYSHVAEEGAKPVQIIAIGALLLYFNVFVVTYLHLFATAWGSGTYGAAFGVPIFGLLFAGIGSRLWRESRGRRHAVAITTAQRSISGAIIVTVFNYPQPNANVSVTIINSIGIAILLILSLEWGRASSGRDVSTTAT